MVASTVGKIELETAGDDTPEERVVERLITKAVYATFQHHLAADQLAELVGTFETGVVVETGDRTPSAAYVRLARELPGMGPALRRLGVGDKAEPATVASAVELVLEGLHLSRRINKERAGTGTVYRR